jgi:hypothetical protein
MPKGIAIAVGVGVVAVIGSVIIFFDTDNSQRSSDILPAPDSNEYEDNQGPDSGEEIDLDEPNGPDSGEDEDNQGPDSGEDEDNQGPDSGEEIDPNEPTSPDSGEDEDNQGPDSGEDEDNQGPDSGEETTLDEDLKNRAKGSCNLISAGSTCVEYIGSYWTTTTAKLNCSDASAFSTNSCPRPALGGCRMGIGTSNEVVTWHYGYGGDPYTEALPYAAMACNALPSSGWIQ